VGGNIKAGGLQAGPGRCTQIKRWEINNFHIYFLNFSRSDFLVLSVYFKLSVNIWPVGLIKGSPNYQVSSAEKESYLVHNCCLFFADNDQVLMSKLK
jgi:hypothetical protein